MPYKLNPFTGKMDYYEEDAVPEPFPVGAIYLNTTGVNPNTELGYGTWTQVAKGNYLFGEA